MGAARRRRRLSVTIGVGVTTLAVSWGAAAGSAHAAPYTVWACANGSGQPVGPGDWRGSRIGNSGRLTATCGSNSTGGVGSLLADATTSVLGAPAATGNGWRVNAAAGTKITGLTLWWAYQVNPVSVPPFGRIQIYADTESPLISDEPDFGAVAAASPSIAFADANKQTYDGLSASGLSLRAWCANWCERSNEVITALFETYRLRVTVDDTSPPTGTAHGLRDGARIAGATPVVVHADDVGGGVRSVSLRVNGQTVSGAAGGEGCADVDAANGDPLEYNLMTPCPAERDAVLVLQPAHLPSSEQHVVTAVATDAAGQDTVLAAARVARAAPPGSFDKALGFFNPDLDITSPRRANGVNGGPARMYLAFVVKRKRGKRTATRFHSRLTVRYGRRARFRGRLTTPQGVPIVGARVWRAVRPVGKSWRLSGKPLVTSKTGRVTGRMPVRGGSRKVQLVYFPYSDLNGHGRTPARSLSVRAASTIRVNRSRLRNGNTAVFFGRILTGPAMERKAVYLQTLVRGRWRPFGTTRADAKGRWKHRFRFAETRTLTVYRIRAVVPAEGKRYPWATGSTRSIRVIVSP